MIEWEFQIGSVQSAGISLDRSARRGNQSPQRRQQWGAPLVQTFLWSSVGKGLVSFTPSTFPHTLLHSCNKVGLLIFVLISCSWFTRSPKGLLVFNSSVANMVCTSNDPTKSTLRIYTKSSAAQLLQQNQFPFMTKKIR